MHPIQIDQNGHPERKEKRFVIIAAMSGVVAALGISAVLMAIAVPSRTQYLLTAAEQADWERMFGVSRWLMSSGFQAVMAGIVLLASISFITAFLQVINPRFKLSQKDRSVRSGTKAIIVGIASLCCFFLIQYGFFMPFTGSPGAGPIVRFIAAVFGAAALWMFAGEQGWAGDLSSWGMPREAQWRRTALLGAVAGGALFVIGSTGSWVFGQYFILVSEVLDRSGETSFLGYQQLTLGLVILLGTSFALAAAVIVALAPVRRDAQELMQRLKVPFASFLVVLILLAGGYWYGGNRYDLDKKSLAGILGVSDESQDSRTVVVLILSKDLPVTVQEWPLKVSGSSFTGQQAITLSSVNLKKLEAYLDAHPDGTIYQYLGRDILAKGYHALWDGEQGLKALQRAAGSQVIHRMLLLARLRVLPVTDGNLKLLQAYSDEKAWYAGGRSALLIAAAYRHFGVTAESDRWLKKAQERGADMAKADFLNEPVVTTGSVRGRIVLNGKPLAGVKTALIGKAADAKKEEDYRISETTLSRALADVQVTGADGRFGFHTLGNGQYVIAIMVEKDVLPVDAKQGVVMARNVPGLVQIGPVATRDVGTIEIDTTGK